MNNIKDKQFLFVLFEFPTFLSILYMNIETLHNENMTTEELFGKSYTLNSKEAGKFLRKPIKWYTYAERVPRVGELIFLPKMKWTGKKSQVISPGDYNYIKNEYFDYAKKASKYYVICQTNLY